jgi:hypothetical protein
LPDKVYKERKAGQGIIVYGWCPAKNKAIALQVDENGRLVIDPEELDTRYLKLNGANSPMTGPLDMTGQDIKFQDFLLTRGGTEKLAIYNHAKTVLKHIMFWTGYGRGFEGTPHITLRPQAGSDTYHVLMRSGATHVDVAKCWGGFLDIMRAGDITPLPSKSLGNISNYWNQAFIDAIICSDSIDLHPTAGDAVIYFKHDGAANEASLRYDKVNKRLELWIDGAIVGYCNAALGWVNGPP